MSQPTNYQDYYDMMKKFADENKLQNFKLRFIVQYEQDGTETITDFYTMLTTATGRTFATANTDFNTLLTNIESTVNL